MPTEKQHIWGDYDSGRPSRRRKKSSFDKSTIVPDTDKSCSLCSNAKIQDVDKKYGVASYCSLKNYTFFSYWKQTIAKDCDSYNVEE